MLGGCICILLVFTRDMESAGQVQDGDVPWTPHMGLRSKGGHLCRWLHDRETKEGLPELTVPTEHYTHQHPGLERKIASKDEEKWGWKSLGASLKTCHQECRKSGGRPGLPGCPP